MLLLGNWNESADALSLHGITTCPHVQRKWNYELPHTFTPWTSDFCSLVDREEGNGSVSTIIDILADKILMSLSRSGSRLMSFLKLSGISSLQMSSFLTILRINRVQFSCNEYTVKKTEHRYLFEMKLLCMLVLMKHHKMKDELAPGAVTHTDWYSGYPSSYCAWVGK